MMYSFIVVVVLIHASSFDLCNDRPELFGGIAIRIMLLSFSMLHLFHPAR